MDPSFSMSNPFSYPGLINGRSMADQLFGPPFQFNNELIINISYLQLPGLAMDEPASKVSIQSLKIIKSREDHEKSEEECSICLEKLFDKENKDAVVKETSCGHKYHGKCIDKWLDIHGSCPLCRYNMTQENEEEVSDVEMDFWDEDDGAELRIGLF
ncbi:E3 ubiquitin-protein ligase RING1-like protein [Carex littledalei]|uniref:E3 ubiquitin-protein ligase RING1-like protein n=1 Tax=Carex littledalei TaxID=544730 RepID=A0A833QPR4_9POAL|nr:E3 ubiquitin-protein ligase RING1-like protein [Carex littledalei]